MSALPKLLLLGDSIRMSYQALVGEQLQGVAEVVGPADNCQYSLFTLSSLGRWLAELGNPDIIHWNNGLHDIGHNPSRCPVQMPLEVYRGNLEHILRQLRDVTPHVIWATSTPVHPSRPFYTDQWGWRNEEIDQYNLAALEVMKTQNVPISDLHAIVAENMDENLAEDQLHLSQAGQMKCAQAVGKIIKQHLPQS
jgi:hypothetical protein